MPGDKRICGDCVTDDFLKKVIAQSPTTSDACDYCDSVAPTIDMYGLADYCDKAIDEFYEVSSLCDAVTIYERTPDGDQLPDVLERILGAPGDAIEDIVELLSDYWFDRDSMEHRYGEDPWFVEKTSFAEPMSDAWIQMERSLRNQARFINPEASKMLESVFGPILDDRTHQGRDVIVECGPGYKIDKFFRARVFQTYSALEKALSHPERHIGPPPPGVGAAGRMNAKGVSVFYGSTDPEIAQSEVRPMVGCHLVIGEFMIIRKLRLLDLEQLGEISLKPSSSPFDPATAAEASRRDFLKILSQNMVMTVMPELEEQSYLITQAIADFLATHPKLNLDGILFSSAQKAMANKQVTGKNVVLFNKASTVLNAEEDLQRDTSVYLWETDEDGSRFEPQVWATLRTKDREHSLPYWESPATTSTLEFNCTSIEVREIREIEYQSFSYPVSFRLTPSKKTAES